MNPLMLFGLPFGLSAAFWFSMGFLRSLTEHIQKYRNRGKTVPNRYKATQIAAIIPAHNEQLAIEKCVKALKRSLPAQNIHVISDGSEDKTYHRARKLGCKAIQLTPGQGKARAIVYVLKHFKLFKNYPFIFIIDADTRIDQNFIKNALPLFNDPDIKVVFGSARITWPKHFVPQLKYYFVAYRERLNRLLHFFFGFGQTWKYTNVNYVIPGFATIWRSTTLKKIPIDTPGLLIEDFNTAFQFHKKHLGKIGYNPDCIGWDQHPETLKDYWKQVRRWNIGFLQTVKVNGVWPSFFWLSLTVFSFEVLVQSIFILFVPLLVLYLLTPSIATYFPVIEWFSFVYAQYGPYQHVTLIRLLIYFFVIDYGMTIFIAILYKRPQFLFYGLFFFPMHYITSLILLSSIIPGFFKSSEGKWVSPKRSIDQLQARA